jgi:hypothetical protein
MLSPKRPPLITSTLHAEQAAPQLADTVGPSTGHARRVLLNTCSLQVTGPKFAHSVVLGPSA